MASDSGWDLQNAILLRHIAPAGQSDNRHPIRFRPASRCTFPMASFAFIRSIEAKAGR
jgi:hypothetical protein